VGDHGRVMFLIAAIFFPLVLLCLLLAMERVERPLTGDDSSQAALEGFLDNARQDEVNTYVAHGLPAALERYRGRLRRSGGGRHRAV
jgi:hypothetical protein